MNDCFWVCIFPARENAGQYDVDTQVCDIPDDVQFLTLYSTDDLDTALGFYDTCIEALAGCDPERLDWLDRVNQCLFIGDMAKVVIYLVDMDDLTVKVWTEHALTVGERIV
jgi:hypothetical protein